jgi:Metal binding domain of Ada
MAWFYRQYANKLRPEDADAYAKVEAAAQSGKIGLWSQQAPTPPWFFRRGKFVKAPGATTPATAGGPIIGNRNSKVYHLRSCPDHSKVSERNSVPFKTEAEAQAAGYRKARDCP